MLENANFHSNENDFLWRQKIVRREKKLVTEKKREKRQKKGSTGFSSAPNTAETYRAHSHAAIAHLGHRILNTVTCCYSRRLATGLNTVILTCFCSMFQLRKSKCYKSFKSEFSGGWARFQSFPFESVPMPDSAPTSIYSPSGDQVMIRDFVSGRALLS